MCSAARSRAHERQAFGLRRVVRALEPLRLVRELVVLDRVAEPARVVAAPEVVQPGLVVDAVGDLQEQDQVLRAQVELALGPAEVEAAVRRRACPRRTCAMCRRCSARVGAVGRSRNGGRRAARPQQRLAGLLGGGSAPAMSTPRTVARTARRSSGAVVARRRSRASTRFSTAARQSSGCTVISSTLVELLGQQRRSAAATSAGSRWCASSIDEPVRPAVRARSSQQLRAAAREERAAGREIGMPERLTTPLTPVLEQLQRLVERRRRVGLADARRRPRGSS